MIPRGNFCFSCFNYNLVTLAACIPRAPSVKSYVTAWPDVYKRQVNIYLSKENAPQEYETIDEAELREDDVIVERIHEDAKTEEKENDKGEKEVVEVSPAKDKVKINKRPVSLSCLLYTSMHLTDVK